jgi:hypothetical protein
MVLRIFFAVCAASLALTTHAAEERFDLRTELGSSYLKDWLGKEVKLYLADEKPPEFAEITRPDTYSATSFSPSIFGGGRRHCLDAFQKAMKSLVDFAAERGYDAVVDIRPVQEGGTSKEVTTLLCTPGYKITSVSFSGSLAMSAAALQKQTEAEASSIKSHSRKPKDGEIFLPADPIITSPAARAILPEGTSLFWGAEAPIYTHRHGPDDYSDQAAITSAGTDAACKEATLKVLRQIADEAKSRKYDSIIKVRSRLNGEFPPALADIECLVSKKHVNVTLQATLAQKK